MKNIIQPADLSLNNFELDRSSLKIKFKQLYTVSELRLETQYPPLVFIKDNIKGFFVLDVTDIISADDGINTIIGANNQRYKKQLSNYDFSISINNLNNVVIKNKDILNFITENGIYMDINSNGRITVKNNISTVAGNRIIIQDDGGLYSSIPPINISNFVSSNSGNIIYPIDNKLFASVPVFVSALGFDQIDSLNVFFSDGSVVKVKVIYDEIIYKDAFNNDIPTT